MSKKKFVHLHVHTEYSLLDGMSKISHLFDHIKEQGMDTVAMTDHGVMYGAVEFYQKAKKAEVKPIIGMEAYTTNIPLDEKPDRNKVQNYHLLLLAKNNEGYRNLMRLTSIGHLEGFYRKPRITREILKKHSEGLICTSACPAGELARALVHDGYDKAKDIAEWFLDVFGDDYYLEIQRHHYGEHAKRANHPDIRRDLEEQQRNEDIINEGVIKLSRDLGIPLIATNDAHYIKKEDSTAQDALVCIATGKDVDEIKRLRFIDTPEYYVKSPEEMYELFEDIPEALENTVKIAEQCNIEIKLGEWFFPKIDLPKGVSAEEHLKKKAVDGLKRRYKEITPEIKKRLAYELKVIIDKGYPEYFLIYQDMAQWAEENDIQINTRGSAAGSLVSYCLGVTSVDPIRYLLPFERFLNPFRPSAPDIDLDISDSKRDEMIGYLIEKYGKDKVAQICTFGRMLAKGSVRDVARVLGYPYSTGDGIAKAIPLGSQGFPMTIERAFDESPDFKAMYDTNEDTKKVVDLAKQIEGNARHISVHAAGVVISPTAMTDFSPLYKEPGGEKIITQYEMHACEDIGLIKLDVLGIRNLTILQDSITLVKEIRGVEIDINEIDIEDKKVFDMLSRGETFGVFQLGGSGITRCLVALKPKRIEDVFIAIALFRPGPMANIDEYIARKEGKKEVEYYHPKMKKFLDKSLGVLVYQDDLLYTALEIAGYNWEEVDKFRKAVGKKIPEEMAKQHIKFVDGCQKYTGMTKDEAEGLWKLFEPFQGYGFNKAHTASYGMVSYQTAYMKANYPVEYMCALMTAESHDSEKVTAAMHECQRMGVQVLPPDINSSGTKFRVVDDPKEDGKKAIRFGLSAIKNVGEAAIDSILAARREQEFQSYADFLARIDGRKANKRVIESLIKVGALSAFGTRASLLSALDEIRNRVSKPKGMENQQGLFGDEEIKTSMRTDTAMDAMLSAEEFSDEEMENFERELLGFSLTSKPLNEVLDPLRNVETKKVDEIEGSTNGKKIQTALVLQDIRVVTTKKSGKEMAFATAKDETGSLDLVIFPKMYEQVRSLLAEGVPLRIEGKLDARDESASILVDSMETQDSLKNGVSNGEKERIRRTKGTFVINIPDGVEGDTLKLLKTLLVKNKGEHAVSLSFEGKKGKVVPLPFKVAWSPELSQQITALFAE